MNIRNFLFLLILIAISACTNQDPAATGVNLKMKAETTQSSFKTGRTSASDITFNEVLLGVRKIELEGSDEDENEHDGENHNDDNENEEIEFKGSFVVDLINGTSTPDFGIANITPGIYEEIEISLDQILPDSNSIFIAFTFTTDAGDLVSVELSTKKKIKLEIEDEAGFQVDQNTITQLLVILNLDALFSSIDLSNAKIDSDGVIRINDTTNENITQGILSNLKDACDAGEDEDHDDDIDGD